ncbi:hypothetical protein D6783_02360, partial [Candidatus Woesearchaeota archaeon]
MVGMTMAGALAYDLADYPTPFITNGVFDGAIVVGEKAATSDVIGAVDIAASLQASATTEVELDIPSTGSVNLVGDAAQFSISSDILELGENVADVKETFTEDDLAALKSGRVSTQQGSTDYNQYLRFGTSGLATMYVDYTADKDDNVGDYLVIQGIRSTPFFEYQLEFESGFQSELDDCTGTSTVTCGLNDLEDTRINIFGTDYTIVDTTLNSNQEVSLELMGGDVSDTLREGETKTYTIDGTDYEV